MKKFCISVCLSLLCMKGLAATKPVILYSDPYQYVTALSANGSGLAVLLMMAQVHLLHLYGILSQTNSRVLVQVPLLMAFQIMVLW